MKSLRKLEKKKRISEIYAWRKKYDEGTYMIGSRRNIRESKK